MLSTSKHTPRWVGGPLSSVRLWHRNEVTLMRQNEDHRKALDRLVEKMRPAPLSRGPKIVDGSDGAVSQNGSTLSGQNVAFNHVQSTKVKHNGKALHEGWLGLRFGTRHQPTSVDQVMIAN